LPSFLNRVLVSAVGRQIFGMFADLRRFAGLEACTVYESDGVGAQSVATCPGQAR